LIVIGYQGIGKSTLCRKNKGKGYIDLESGLFKNPNNCNHRWSDWADIYCNIAISLSDQGYTVFVSSHKEVQNQLEKTYLWKIEPVMAVYPSLDIRDQWVERLLARWKESGRNKDEIAYLDAKEHYEEEVMRLMRLQVVKCEIYDMDYSLEEIINENDFVFASFHSA